MVGAAYIWGRDCSARVRASLSLVIEIVTRKEFIILYLGEVAIGWLS